ncbi:SCP2 sterol-binding domain-containing protein [Jatrophihabitans endophyticus]|uniref:SCP2 sterol-binding domain-containing protein n=1 Tax=Jatrophihabitans endophyticus TaxID=1206085 RepID=UPI001A03CCD5|nr:SCP2 sterol-binding domain-containing protein [Jatrophihabitans endophyticus]MBE7187435.1 SCP2 sterol-binding domain-containing protein [Jatrophihabitans endophyticus]
MPFTDADEVVHYIGGIFETAFATEGIGDKLAATGVVLLVRSTDPDSAFVVDTANRRVLAGDDGAQPSATMTMSADTQNAYWQGKVNLPVAMARGQIKVSGQVGQLLKLAPLSKPLFAGYVERLKADGRDDLVL